MRPLAAIDAEIHDATEAVARTRAEAFDVGSNLARLVAGVSDRIAAGLAEERAAYEAAKGRLEALLAEREAVLEAAAVRALEREASALPEAPPPPVEPVKALRDALSAVATVLTALDAASKELVLLAPLGDSNVSVTLTPESDGEVSFDRIGRVHRALAAAEQARVALLAFDGTLPAEPIPVFEAVWPAFMSSVRDYHRLGVAVREARDRYVAIAESLTARREAAERARRLRSAWESTRRGRTGT